MNLGPLVSRHYRVNGDDPDVLGFLLLPFNPASEARAADFAFPAGVSDGITQRLAFDVVVGCVIARMVIETDCALTVTIPRSPTKISDPRICVRDQLRIRVNQILGSVRKDLVPCGQFRQSPYA